MNEPAILPLVASFDCSIILPHEFISILSQDPHINQMTKKIIFEFFSDRQRFSRLDLNTNPSNDDMSAERRRQLKLSFQPESIKPIIKPQALPERTR